MSFVERFIIQRPYFRGSTIGGSTVYNYKRSKAEHSLLKGIAETTQAMDGEGL